MVFRFANGDLRARSGTAATSTTCRSRWPRRSASRTAAATTTRPGVLRDMVQNHMFQLLALVAMEPPSSFEADAVRDEKVKVLKSIRPMRPEDVLQRRGARPVRPGRDRRQAGAGLPERAQGARRPRPPRPTPRSSSRWRTGAGRACRSICARASGWRGATTEIMIQFRRPPLLLFEAPSSGGRDREQIDPNRLVHAHPAGRGDRDPGEGQAARARRSSSTRSSSTSATRTSARQRRPPATSACSTTAWSATRTLFHRADMVEAAWKIATPILDVWQSLPPRDFPNYPAGSMGPAEADQLMRADGRAWWWP